MSKLVHSLIVLAGLLPALAGAAPVRIFVAGAAKAGVQALLPGFERAGGDSVEASYDTAGALRDRVLAGERPDLIILSDAAVDAIAAHGLSASGGLPAPYDLRTPYAIVVLGASEPGRRLMRYLDTAAARAQFEASGFAAR